MPLRAKSSRLLQSNPAFVVGLLLLLVSIGGSPFAGTVVAQSAAPAEASRVKLLAFGLNAYKRKPLPYCCNDARVVDHILGKGGVPAASRKVLLDVDAKGFVSGLKWLKEAVRPGDLAVVFFSGHGGQIPDESGDEADGLDEVWVTCDGVAISDDILSGIFAKLPCDVLLISDSCHSGTMARTLTLPARSGAQASGAAHPKRYQGALKSAAEQPDWLKSFLASGGSRSVGARGQTKLQEFEGVGVFAACAEEEVANGAGWDYKVSPFTGAFLEALSAARASEQLSFGQLTRATHAALAARGLPRQQTPSLQGIAADSAVPSPFLRAFGSPPSAAAPPPPTPPAPTPTPTPVRPQPTNAAPAPPSATPLETARQRLATLVRTLLEREQVAPQSRRPLLAGVRALGGPIYQSGDLLELEVRAAANLQRPIHLFVANVGPTGEVSVLYPNPWEPKLTLQAGQRLTIGRHSSLTFGGAKGTERLLVFALEYNPLEGIDVKSFRKAGKTPFAQLGALKTRPVAAASGAQSPPVLTARGIFASGPRPRPSGSEGAGTQPAGASSLANAPGAASARVGEGWDRRMLQLQHR